MGVNRSFYHVDPGEEIASVLQGVKTAAGERVAVVLPPDPSLFRNDLNLRLLMTYAKEGNKELALVTQDAAVIRLASYFHIPVYCATNLVWQPEGLAVAGDITEPLPVIKLPLLPLNTRSNRRRSALKQRLAAAGIAIGALAVLAFIYSARVIVTITPNLQYMESEVEVAMQPIAAGATLPFYTVARYSVSSTVEATSQVNASGQRAVGIAPASGTVIFFNETKKEILVPKGTIVATDGGTSYTTNTSVRVPPVTVEYFMQVPVGTKAGQAEVSVQAQLLGSVGNVAAGRIVHMPQGPAGLRVTNPEPTRHGADEMRSVVTTNDINSVRKRVLQALQDACEGKLVATTGEGAYLIPSTVGFEQEKVTIAPASGTETAIVKANASAIARGDYVLLSQVLSVALTRVSNTLPAGMALFGSPSINYIVGILVDKDNLQVSLRYPIGPHINLTTVLDTIAGLTPAEAREALGQKGMPVSLDVSGNNGKRLPNWKSWIKIIVAEPVYTVHTAEAFRE